MPVSSSIDEIWTRVRDIAGASRRDRTITSWLTLKSVDERAAVLEVQNPQDYRAAASASKRLGELFREAVGAAVDVRVEPPAGASVDEASLAEGERKALSHPVVEQAKDLFGARVVRVERVAPDPPPATGESDV